MNTGFTLEKLFPEFWRKVLGSGKNFPLERKVLNAALFASVGVAISLFVAGLVLRLPAIGNYIALGGAVVFGFLYVIGRGRREPKWLPWIFLFLLYIILIITWRFESGISGGATFLLIAVAGVIPLILPPNGQILGFLSAMTVAITMYVFSLSSIDTLPHRELTPSSIHDVMITVILIGAGLSLVGLLVINTHRHARTKIKTLYSSLQDMNETLEERNMKLEVALGEIKTLRGIVPICAHCKKIRNDKGFYESVENYIEKHTYAEFSHGYCPDCTREHYPELFATDDPG